MADVIHADDMGTRRAYSLGSLLMYLYPVTEVGDASTHATALTNIQGEWMHCTDDSVGLVKKGADVGEASGTLTVNTSMDTTHRAGSIYVLTTELE